MMDDNTTKVLMAVIALITTVVTPLVVVYVGKMTNNKVTVLQTKVEEYHKEVNGNMGKLLKTTEELATAKEMARNLADNPVAGDPAKLKITGGEIKITGETKKKP